MKSLRFGTAAITCFAFVGAIFWPHIVRAQAGPAQAAPPVAPPATPSQETLAQAKQHFEAGKNAYNAGDYANAIREFKQAEALRPSPVLDYNIGLANEKLGKRRVAVKYYKRYLEHLPSAANRPQVEASIAELEREIAAQPGQYPPAQPGPGETAADMPPPQPSAQQQQQYQYPAQPGYSTYDPYASTSGQPYAQQAPPPKKKKSYWWVALIVIGGAALITGIAVAVWYTANSTTYYYAADHALAVPNRAAPTAEAAPVRMHTLFEF